MKIDKVLQDKLLPDGQGAQLWKCLWMIFFSASSSAASSEMEQDSYSCRSLPNWRAAVVSPFPASLPPAPSLKLRSVFSLNSDLRQLESTVRTKSLGGYPTMSFSWLMCFHTLSLVNRHVLLGQCASSAVTLIYLLCKLGPKQWWRVTFIVSQSPFCHIHCLFLWAVWLLRLLRN